MTSVARYWHTIRHLKPVQVYGRLLFRLARPRPDLRPAPPVRPVAPGGFVRGAERPVSFVGPDTFTFLNETRGLAANGWDDPAASRLWRYHLHYFDDLNASGADGRAERHHALLERWVRENAPGTGTGWEPYPTSLRIVNWIKWAWRGHMLPPGCVDSLAIQSRWLSGRMERHLLGNHYLANAKALVFAGRYFEGPEAEGWLAEGMRVLRDQVPEQILPDGGHFELSPMYHALALEDVLDLHNVLARPEPWWERLPAMRACLAALTHPDGGIGFFNDAALGGAPPFAELEAYAVRLGLPAADPSPVGVTHLAASGYVRVASREAVALLDVGAIGPDYLPAHAHADSLSFELSLFGQRVLVNSGTSVYAAGVERERQRGTAAHNTVIVDGADSSEVWSAFRVARRAHPMNLEVTPGDTPRVHCAHDGYGRLPGRPVHRRDWSFSPAGLVVTDRVTGVFKTAQARFHLHPDVRAEASGNDRLALVLPGGRRATLGITGGRARVEASTWHPGFGVSTPNQCLAVDLLGPELRCEFRWGDA